MGVWVKAVFDLMQSSIKQLWTLSVGRKEASMNEVKKKPLEMLVIEWLNIKRVDGTVKRL